MRVTALLYLPPGQGSFYRKEQEMPDDKMPRTIGEFKARTMAALSHFWGNVNHSAPEFIEKYDDGKRYVVSSSAWSVEWATDEQAEKHRLFMHEYRTGKRTAEEFFAYAMESQPQERRSL